MQGKVKPKRGGEGSPFGAAGACCPDRTGGQPGPMAVRFSLYLALHWSAPEVAKSVAGDRKE